MPTCPGKNGNKTHVVARTIKRMQGNKLFLELSFCKLTQFIMVILTKWSPIRSVIMLVINSGSMICSILSMITDRIGRYKVLLPIINHDQYNFQENKCIHFSSCLMLQNLSILENLQFGRVSGCCYGYCDKFCDQWIKMSALKVPIT